MDGRALVPRPETEILLSEALREAPEARRVLDAGTGQRDHRHLLPARAARGPRRRPRHLARRPRPRARERRAPRRARTAPAARLGLAHRRSRRTPFDAILSNPPYLALGEAPHLPATVRDHDPRRALFAGDDGLAAIRHLLDTAPPISSRPEACSSSRSASARRPPWRDEVRRRAGLVLPADRAGPRGHPARSPWRGAGRSPGARRIPPVGQVPHRGTLAPDRAGARFSGAKNSALPCLAAALLTAEPVSPDQRPARARHPHDAEAAAAHRRANGARSRTARRHRRDAARSARPTRRTSSSRRCAPRCSCSGRCWPGPASSACRCPADVRSACGRSTCTWRPSGRWAPRSLSSTDTSRRTRRASRERRSSSRRSP